MQEILSKDSLARALFIIIAAKSPHNSLIFFLLFLLSFNTIRIHSNISMLLKTSKIPSHPITIKLYCSFNSYSTISGVETTTPFCPPNFSNLASTSPNVLETDNLPGLTLQGISICFPF